MPFELRATNLDAMGMEARREVLLDLAKLEEPSLGLLGLTPENGQVFVLDVPELVYAGAEIDALRAFAFVNALEVGEPVQVAPEYAEGREMWEVRMFAYGNDAGAIATAHSQEQVHQALLVALRDLSGGQVSEIKTWAAQQGAEDIVASLERMLHEVPKKQPKPKLAQFLVSRWHKLQALPVAQNAKAGVDPTPSKVRRKAAYDCLSAPSGVSPMGAMEAPKSSWAVRVFEDGGRTYANHHDLIAALHMGLDPQGIEPWPNDVAHRFLISEELRRTMRSRGFAELRDFDPSTLVHLRVSKLEFTPAATGDAAQDPDKPFEQGQEKPQWPPELGKELRVVIILDRARLAYETEAQWERVALRTPVQCSGKLWVEREGPYEKPRKRKASDNKRTAKRAVALETA